MNDDVLLSWSKRLNYSEPFHAVYSLYSVELRWIYVQTNQRNNDIISFVIGPPFCIGSKSILRSERKDNWITMFTFHRSSVLIILLFLLSLGKLISPKHDSCQGQLTKQPCIQCKVFEVYKHSHTVWSKLGSVIHFYSFDVCSHRSNRRLCNVNGQKLEPNALIESLFFLGIALFPTYFLSNSMIRLSWWKLNLMSSLTPFLLWLIPLRFDTIFFINIRIIVTFSMRDFLL